MKKIIVILFLLFSGFYLCAQQVIMRTDTLAVNNENEPVILGTISLDLNERVYGWNGNSIDVVIYFRIILPGVVGNNVILEQRRPMILSKANYASIHDQHKTLANTTIRPAVQDSINAYDQIPWENIFPELTNILNN